MPVGLAEDGAVLLGTVVEHAPAETVPGHRSHQQLVAAILE